jgi:nitric oxide reductase subunit B
MDRSHGHFAFWGAYSCGVISVLYLVLQKTRNLAFVDGSLWKWSFATPNLGLIGMTGALLVSGFVQAFVERAIGGSTLNAFISGQENAWFVDGMVARFLLAIVFTGGYVVLVWDALSLGRRAPAVATVAAAQ